MLKVIPQYEVSVLMSHEDYMHEKIQELQDEGWEIAGDILVKNQRGNCGDTYVFIPFKRVKR